jgi:23S rRNA (cytosine1962-C5)-methyltransferase
MLTFAHMSTFLSDDWKSYSLIDCGGGEKLEKFGDFTLIRPEPTAVWPRKLSTQEWKNKADARFEPTSKTAGQWIRFNDVPKSWIVDYPINDHTLNFELQLTKFKHVGLFPEQSSNWQFIAQQCARFENPKVLNLFAYTGGASLAANAAGANVTHVDAIKQVISWSRKNMELSGMEGIRWLVEDALKFVEKEIRRGKTYEGIVMDPPAWGLGPKGEKWKLEQKVNELLNGARHILAKESFVVLNTYSGFSPQTLQNLVKTHFKEGKAETAELVQKCETGNHLSTGSVARIEFS